PQTWLDFGASQLKVTRAYYAKYGRINEILSENREILEGFHKDVSRMCKEKERKRLATFNSEQFLRAILVMDIEQLSLRGTVIRIDDSEFLRRFVGISYGAVMDYTTLSKVYKAIRPQTWKRMNALLGQYAIEEEMIRGESLRVDTTAYETNIHYPTDSSLLGDGYRVLSRWISVIRDYDSEAVRSGRLQEGSVKRLVQRLARGTYYKEKNRKKLRRLYRALIGHVEHVLAWSMETERECEARMAGGRYDLGTERIIRRLIAQRAAFELGLRKALRQARRRVLDGEMVPNSEKIFSLFETHTELLKRGKAGKQVEFGHMVLLHQVENKFISDYEVFKKRVSDESMVDDILDRHEKVFGRVPENFAADKGFYESVERLDWLETKITNVSIGKKGNRTLEEIEREHDPVFKSLQRFRAGIEGTISFLKRCFKMARCLYRSFKTYCSSVGSHVFAHNLVVLARL
ncbi:MAG: ISNCY family transposase, partial [Candidatus Krumholzibacteria bacterium]|nr:ISNCY family transposase [Candidatus Krumholzibacteria bacterium]